MARLLKCSVCCDTFHFQKEWLHHLLQDKHQFNSRREIFRWKKPERDCIFIVYATFPVACDDVLQFFSRGQNNIVTDFVYFSSHPKVGFMQFESKEKAAEIFVSVNGPHVKISDKLLELKKGVDCLDLEWADRLSSLSPDLSQQQLVNIKNHDTCEEKQEEDIVATVEQPPKKRRKISKTKAVPLPNILDSEGDVPVLTLRQQFTAICQSMKISGKKFQAAIDLKSKLSEALSFTYPNCELKIFRNWYLKLKNTDPRQRRDLFLFLDIHEPSNSNPEVDSNPGPRTINSRKMTRKKVTLDLLDFHFKDENGVSEICLKSTRGENLKEPRGEDLFFHTPSNITFTIITFPLFLPEVETCRLLEYLLTFDPRAKPLLILIRYWALVNKIRLTKEDECFTPNFPPNPATLDWLIILFLCNKGVLPTPRQVCERRHDKLIFYHSDIGFNADKEFARTYTSYKETDEDVHAFNILSLAQQFFQFYPQQLGRGYLNLILNTRDGEIIPMGDFLKYNCQLTVYESNLTKTGKRHNQSLYRENAKPGEMSLTMINPLFVKHGFPICPQAFETSVCPVMKLTGNKLKESLKAYKENKGKANNIDLKSVFQI